MTDPIDPIVGIQHLRAAGLCSRGARIWCQRFELNYMRFVREGYPASVIESKGDALGNRVASMARREVGRSNG